MRYDQDTWFQSYTRYGPARKLFLAHKFMLAVHGLASARESGWPSGLVS